MPDVSEQELYSMQLHEHKPEMRGVRILKVPGGWIYWMYREENSSKAIALAGVFVPESPK
jgi:hypothetical protein